MENHAEVLLARKQPWASPELAILNLDEFTAHNTGGDLDGYSFDGSTGPYLPS